jgi:cytochrome c peroxidase
MQGSRSKLLRIGLAYVFLLNTVFTGAPARAEVQCYDSAGLPTTCEGPGGIRYNGTRTQPAIKDDGHSQAAAGIPTNLFTTPMFLFEPESPYDTLKSVPTWNELEQLLDNPYKVTPDSITPGNDDGYPSYRSTIVRRPSFSIPGATLLNPGPPLPAFVVHPLNYNPTDGEEMRLLNPGYPGGEFSIPDELYQDLIGDPTGNRWTWTFKTVTVSPGEDRVDGPEIDYNGPMKADEPICITNLELVPPEGTNLCGYDPGEPNYPGFGVNNSTGYSTPAIPGVSSPGAFISSSARLFDPTRGVIQPRNSGTGAGGLRKPSLRVPEAGGSPNNPNYLKNTNANNTTPSNENDYVRNRNVAMALGKSLFWDMQVGSDGVQSCGTCHFTGAGTDTRTKNQINPNHLGGDLTINLHGINAANQVLTAADFPFHKLSNPDVAGDPACTTAIWANVTNVTPALDHPLSGNFKVCDSANIVSDINDVSSSMGVVFSPFVDIAAVGVFQLPNNGVQAVMPDIRVPGALDPIPVFQGFRRVEPRNTPTMQAAGFNFDNFWDGRARHDFNGGSVFGAADPQKHVFVNDPPGGANLAATRQLIKFASIASLATGPGLSEFEMSFLGRNWSKLGKKLLQASVTPLANQLVASTDSVLGPYSNQGGASSTCTSLAVADRSGSWSGTNVAGKPGLCISYQGLIRQAFYPKLWQNTAKHLNGCYTDNNSGVHPAEQCASGVASIKVLQHGGPNDGTVQNSTADPFDGYVLTIANGPVTATNTNQFTQMEGNFSLFWGLAVDLWVQILVPDNTPFDQFLEKNPEAFLSLGDSSEALLVDDLLNCTSSTQRGCFRENGHFKRDPGLFAHTDATGEGGAGGIFTPAGGTRNPATDPDPLLGADIFFASNLSLKNPNFRSARCGACHNMPTLTDHTMPFTFKAQLPDFSSEFSATTPGLELLVEPLGRSRVISGFLLESEIAENGQDAIERRFINQSIAPNPVDGLAWPDGVFNPLGDDGLAGTADDYKGAGQAFIDNGVYNIGVRPIGNDIGRGGDDAFGWPLSIASLLLKNLGGTAYEPNVPANPLTGAPGRGSGPMTTFNPSLGPEGGLFEESAQDQQINPGGTDEPLDPKLPLYLAPFINGIPVGDAQPELDEPVAGINTLTDVPMLEGYIDIIGPVSPSAVKNEALNMGESELMGTWPVTNRVIRDGAFKAPQLRDVELTGPYFHNGGLLTLRQVVDFYTRGGDFPITNAAHRDFLLTNLNMEAQSNLNGVEKTALVDFLLELTDERVAYDRAPFDHPEVIVPLDGKAPDNTLSRGALLALTAGDCAGVVGAGPCFRDVPAVGAAGFATREPAFLNVRSDDRNSPHCNPALGPISHYCQ